eukprot:TRINITY_DN16309_c0_g4_i1.p1 TRINITY_DN16309_c0_g4~~TRINITY_DN16309_c0_g4_i1.p1  ORF type:complete len:481 (-),score=99.95 TRINITY_DN16309_c0_g4_i1:571-2013(-)
MSTCDSMNSVNIASGGGGGNVPLTKLLKRGRSVSTSIVQEKSHEGVEYDGIQASKLRCIFSYFRQILTYKPGGIIQFRRKNYTRFKSPNFIEDSRKNHPCLLPKIIKDNTPLSSYEKPDVIQLYACKKNLVCTQTVLLPNGHTTEFEERCLASPELLVLGILAGTQLLQRECFEVMGTINYNKTSLSPHGLFYFDSNTHQENPSTCSSSVKSMMGVDLKGEMKLLSLPYNLADINQCGTGSHLIICDPVSEVNNPSLHSRRYYFAGIELDKLYGALFPYYDSVQGVIKEQVHVAIGRYGCEEYFGCPKDIKFLLLACICSYLRVGSIKFHQSLSQKGAEIDYFFKLWADQEIDLKHIWQHLIQGIDPPSFKQPFHSNPGEGDSNNNNKQPRYIRAVAALDTNQVLDYMRRRMINWAKEQKTLEYLDKEDEKDRRRADKKKKIPQKEKIKRSLNYQPHFYADYLPLNTVDPDEKGKKRYQY